MRSMRANACSHCCDVFNVRASEWGKRRASAVCSCCCWLPDFSCSKPTHMHDALTAADFCSQSEGRMEQEERQCEHPVDSSADCGRRKQKASGSAASAVQHKRLLRG
jgi:hypothetical protein